ncbi:hypothetical protein Bbelb_048990 [Branchiostoma belcheri]|nr:hypothetical protein Bbelb_048990 [Branchiostoma belcheri]
MCPKLCPSHSVPERSQNGTQPDCPEPCRKCCTVMDSPPRVPECRFSPGTVWDTRRVSQTMRKHILGQGIRVSRTVLSPQAQFGTRAECHRPCPGMNCARSGTARDSSRVSQTVLSPEARFGTRAVCPNGTRHGLGHNMPVARFDGHIVWRADDKWARIRRGQENSVTRKTGERKVSYAMPIPTPGLQKEFTGEMDKHLLSFIIGCPSFTRHSLTRWTNSTVYRRAKPAVNFAKSILRCRLQQEFTKPSCGRIGQRLVGMIVNGGYDLPLQPLLGKVLQVTHCSLKIWNMGQLRDRLYKERNVCVYKCKHGRALVTKSSK